MAVVKPDQETAPTSGTNPLLALDSGLSTNPRLATQSTPTEAAPPTHRPC
ncbi:MAG: hypothetical protein LBL92_03620 [Propionibacteriaceae bacterium]|nr:hypothetical protein [Propionibacteriaceae bacterium]